MMLIEESPAPPSPTVESNPGLHGRLLDKPQVAVIGGRDALIHIVWTPRTGFEPSGAARKPSRWPGDA
jgi:hypothetical protein